MYIENILFYVYIENILFYFLHTLVGSMFATHVGKMCRKHSCTFDFPPTHVGSIVPEHVRNIPFILFSSNMCGKIFR